MESIMLTIKFALFYGFEVFVIAVMAGATIMGLYQIVRNRTRESHTLILTEAYKNWQAVDGYPRNQVATGDV